MSLRGRFVIALTIGLAATIAFQNCHNVLEVQYSSSVTPPVGLNPVVDGESAFSKNCLRFPISDWISQLAIDWSSKSAMAHPTDCQIVNQNPPDFHWPDEIRRRNNNDLTSSYLFTLRDSSGKVEEKSAPYNWIVWSKNLSAGSYEWSEDRNFKSYICASLQVSSEPLLDLFPYS